MNRSQLIQLVADRAQVDPKDCERIVRLMTETITENIARGEKITISGFGTFERRRRRATVARNPQTGEPMKIDEQNVAAFRAGSALKDAVKTTGG